MQLGLPAMHVTNTEFGGATLATFVPASVRPSVARDIVRAGVLRLYRLDPLDCVAKLVRPPRLEAVLPVTTVPISAIGCTGQRFGFEHGIPNNSMKRDERRTSIFARASRRSCSQGIGLVQNRRNPLAGSASGGSGIAKFAICENLRA